MSDPVVDRMNAERSFYTACLLKKMQKNSIHIVTTILASAVLFVGCSAFGGTETMQIKACAEDVKSGLNDPNSLEIISTRAFKVNDGTHRIELKFTAKNAFGGRVRREAICGFKTEKDIVLNPDDIFNKDRKFARKLRDAGIN